MFSAIKNSVRRSVFVIFSLHVLLVAFSPLLHAHSATPTSLYHPDELHFHSANIIGNIGMCPFTGELKVKFTAETSDGRQLDFEDKTFAEQDQTTSPIWLHNYVFDGIKTPSHGRAQPLADKTPFRYISAPALKLAHPQAP
jgi:hypothetical protein